MDPQCCEPHIAQEGHLVFIIYKGYRLCPRAPTQVGVLSLSQLLLLGPGPRMFGSLRQPVAACGSIWQQIGCQNVWQPVAACGSTRQRIGCLILTVCSRARLAVGPAGCLPDVDLAGCWDSWLPARWLAGWLLDQLAAGPAGCLPEAAG